MKSRIIVSLTTYPARINSARQTIESILAGTKMPDKIVLYLAKPQFPNRKLPKDLTDLAKKHPIFEIRWTGKDTKPYKKLIPALKDFPNDVIITIDDDIVYPRDQIATLLRCHRKYPKAICGRRVSRAKTMDVSKWKLYRFMRTILWGKRPQLYNKSTGCGGILYPPKALHPDVMKERLFMKLCPTTDDNWFWAMAVVNGTKTAVASRSLHLDYVPGSQDTEDTLWKINCGTKNVNQRDIESLAKHYPAIRKLLTIKND